MYLRIGKIIWKRDDVIKCVRADAVNGTTGQPVGWFYTRLLFSNGQSQEFIKDEAVVVWNIYKDMSLCLLEDADEKISA